MTFQKYIYLLFTLSTNNKYFNVSDEQHCCFEFKKVAKIIYNVKNTDIQLNNIK